tara:strand:- start:124 stop:351 length:228 start_codon:yes stop_codon:yes gene_type:complete
MKKKDKNYRELPKTVIHGLETVMENLEGAAELIDKMRRAKSYGHLTRLRMGIYRQRNYLKSIKEICKRVRSSQEF